MASVVVPISGASVRARVEDGVLVEEGPVPAPPLARCACAGRWVAWVDGHDICVHGADGVTRRLQTPSGHQVDALAISGDVLFVGGRNERTTEALGCFDLMERPRRWRTLPLPPEISAPGKSIDDLVLDGDRLIAVDDFIMPKWLVVYDVADPRLARLVEVRPLPVHNSSEVVRAGALGGRWFATFSTAQNHGRGSRHAAVYARDTLEYCGSVTVAAPPPFGPVPPEDPAPWWYGAAVVADRLLVAAGESGIGVLELGGVAPRPPGPEERDPPWATRLGRELRYVVPPGVVPGPIGPLSERRAAPRTGARSVLAAGDDRHALVVHGPADALDTRVVDVRAL